MVILLTVLVGCTAPQALVVPSEELISRDETQVRLHVIGRLIGPDDTFGGQQDPKHLYVISPSTSEEVREAIRFIAWRDRMISVHWIASKDAVRVNAYGEPPKRGAFIELGKVDVTDGQYRLSASISFSKYGEAGGGATYVYENRSEKWILIGKEDDWISSLPNSDEHYIAAIRAAALGRVQPVTRNMNE